MEDVIDPTRTATLRSFCVSSYFTYFLSTTRWQAPTKLRF
ncbi:hypothetical protein T07_5508 [Trichinella nelsoni]|uniref:Uncharacterized protein n=1 Tax=Trichinella nelsoni TaxID=6336 RepID=A0A0V0RA72_9BILA|nr:hypothetical protein T07_5508 [Trichinella nelsoni]